MANKNKHKTSQEWFTNYNILKPESLIYVHPKFAYQKLVEGDSLSVSLNLSGLGFFMETKSKKNHLNLIGPFEKENKSNEKK